MAVNFKSETRGLFYRLKGKTQARSLSSYVPFNYLNQGTFEIKTKGQYHTIYLFLVPVNIETCNRQCTIL